MNLIQRDLIRSLGKTRNGLWEEVVQGSGKQIRTGLAEKLSASILNGITGQKI